MVSPELSRNLKGTPLLAFPSALTCKEAVMKSVCFCLLVTVIFLFRPYSVFALQSFYFKAPPREAVKVQEGARADALDKTKSTPEATSQSVNASPDYSSSLRPLQLGSAVKYVTGNADNNSIVPVVNLNYSDCFEHKFELKSDKVTKQYSTDSKGNYICTSAWYYDFALELKPEPSAGSTAAVAQAIRDDAGTASLHLGLRYNGVSLSGPYKAPHGLEVAATLKASYQKATATNPTNTGVTNTNFMMLNPQASVGYWTPFAFFGYKYQYNYTSGGDNSLTDNINDTSTHKVMIVINANKLSGNSADSNTPLLLEIDYTGAKNKFSNGTITTALVKSFTFFQ
jgi:hypothetical protein